MLNTNTFHLLNELATSRGVARIFSLGRPNYIFIHSFTQLHFYPLTLNYPLLFFLFSFPFNMFSLDQALKNNWKLNNNNNNKRLVSNWKLNIKIICVCVCMSKRKLLLKYCHSLTLHILSVVFFFIWYFVTN